MATNTQNTANAMRNDTSVAAAIIKAHMNNEITSGNRQRDLVLYMFEAEVSYSMDSIKTLHQMEKASQKRERVYERLADLSPDFEETLARVARNAELIKARDTEPHRKSAAALQLETDKRKLNAAYMLYMRALDSVYFLRHAKALEVDPAKATPGALAYVVDTGRKSKRGEAMVETIVESGNAIQSKGAKLIREALGKSAPTSRKTGNAANVGVDGVSMAINVLDTFIGTSNKEHVGSFAKPITDYPDKEQEAMERMFRRLFITMFGDETGAVDSSTVLEWIKQQELDKAQTIKTKQPEADAA